MKGKNLEAEMFCYPLNLMTFTSTICLLSVYFVSAAGCHWFDLIYHSCHISRHYSIDRKLGKSSADQFLLVKLKYTISFVTLASLILGLQTWNSLADIISGQYIQVLYCKIVFHLMMISRYLKGYTYVIVKVFLYAEYNK